MSIILNNVCNDSNETFQSTLEGVNYTFIVKYNTRDASWSLQIGRSGEDPVVKTKIVIGNNLLAPYYHLEDIPQGGLYVIDEEELLDARPFRDDFGIDKRFFLLYETVEEANS